MRIRRLLRTALLLLALHAAAASAAERLPALDVDLAATTVSGVSSGGYMAVQFHVAHSAMVRGVGAIAAGPYYCAQGSVFAARYNCTDPGTWTPLPPAQALAMTTAALAAGSLIDPTRDLAGSRVWLFHGTRDRTVAAPVVEALRAFYLHFVPAANIVLVRDVPAGHGMITLDAGGACAATASPFINDCDYDAAGRMLEHLLGPLALPTAAPSGRLVAFAQGEFADGDAFAIGMADAGYAYVPRACEAERCRVHVAFHGCRQNAESVGEQFVREAGYNRWAEANRLIVLYPQTKSSLVPLNPKGCWDWWGYTGADYATVKANQIETIWNMLQAISGDTARPRE